MITSQKKILMAVIQTGNSKQQCFDRNKAKVLLVVAWLKI